MSLILTPQTEAEVRHWVESGQYPDADTVIHQALQALKDREEARFLQLRELVLAGHNSGKGEELTPELWDRLEREAEEAYQRGEKPSPYVCP